MQIASITTNEQGEYEYATEEDYLEQTLDFIVEKEGFERKNISYEIDKAEIKSDILLNELEKGTKEKTRIFGTIRNSRNRDPVKDASITLSIEGTQIALISSNEQGEYEYTADEDYIGQTLDFVIKKEGFIRKDISHEIERFEIESDFMMDEIEIEIKGKICDETDSPLDNASISFSIGGSTIDLVSDKDGSFSFTIGQQFLNQTIGYEVNKEGFKVKSGKLKLLENLKCINISKSIPPTVSDKTWIKNAVVGIGLIGLTGLVIYLFALANTGSINITSDPSVASIYLDDNYEGTTPKTISGVSAGSHTIKITKSGYKDHTETVTVTAGETKTVIAEMDIETGSIYVTSDPSVASIYLDDNYEGTTPKTISGVSAGSHTIKITKSGYKDHTETVTVTAGETTSVSAPLVPLKEGALIFSLKIVETYIEGDADRYCSYLADYIYSLEGEGPIEKIELCEYLSEESPFPFGHDYSQYTMDDYLDNYNPYIMDYEEYSEVYPSISNLNIDGWTPDADDFLFIGWELQRDREDFMWDDLLAYMVTYQNDEWELIALSG